MMSRWVMGAVGAAASAVFLCNLAPWFAATTTPATLEYLAAAKIQTTTKEKKNITEAQGLSSLLPEMDAHGVRLHAVVFETLGVEEFREFFKGDIYLDFEKIFYGPIERWMPIITGFGFEPIYNYIKAIKVVQGNLDGEGRLMGAVFVIGPGDQGILYQHHSRIYGDFANLDDVKAAIQKVKNT